MRPIDTLERLPFVSAIFGGDSRVRLQTPERAFLLDVVTLPYPAGTAALDRAMTRMIEQGRARTILFSARLSRPAARRLLAGGYNFADARGNCHVSLCDRYVATIIDFAATPEAGDHVAESTAIEETAVPVLESAPGRPRAPGYQVVFALLAQPDLLTSTIREIASAAGVSRTAVTHALAYLEKQGWTAGRRAAREWVHGGRAAALDMWVEGYGESVRTRMRPLVLQTPHADLAELRERIGEVLEDVSEWRWYGDTAAHDLIGHYGGRHISLLAGEDIESRLKAIPAMTARRGNLLVVRSFAPLCLAGATPATPHPLLLYAELSNSPDPRSKESARLLLAEGLLP